MAQSRLNPRQISFQHNFKDIIHQKKYLLLPKGVNDHVEAFGALDDEEFCVFRNALFNMDVTCQTTHLALLQSRVEIVRLSMGISSGVGNPHQLQELEKAQATSTELLKSYQARVEGYSFVIVLLDAELTRAGLPSTNKPWSDATSKWAITT